MQRLGFAIFACLFVISATGYARAGQTEDEAAVRALAVNFVNAFIQKDAERRASLFTEDGSFVTPPGDFLRGRAAMVNEFGPEAQHAVNGKTQAAFSNFRYDFITPDVVVVDSLLTVRNVTGDNGTIVPTLPIDFFYVAVRHGNGWLIQDGRAHFAAAPANVFMKRSQ
jgi:uncharacterized protein (TIGR02246 family)